MAKRKCKRVMILIQLMITAVFFLGCKKESVEEISKISLNKGAFVNESTSYETFNFNSENTYEEIDTEGKVITNFNMKSNTYTFYKDNSFYVNYNSKDIKIEHNKIASLKVSPEGDYVFYFINDEYLEPAVMDLKNEKEILLDNKAIISGQFIDWITDTKLAYYGVDIEEKTTGIFTYDVKTQNEDNIYKISNGYVKFLKHIDDGLALVEEHYGEDTVLNIVSVNGDITEISREVIDINDIESINDKLYLLGRVKNNSYSIYELDNGVVKRLLFDFPNVLYAEKGLSVNEAGEILFVGSVANGQAEHVYKYSNGSVVLVSDDITNCNFININ
ncbi:hypothetical protein [Clostridium sp.]|uniref:hypothetical protein n=1 Tax=Clostridium sp. TaxID=1506 RepID=UPI00261B505B|nr:hypothetical protein [Clostridium sp.]